MIIIINCTKGKKTNIYFTFSIIIIYNLHYKTKASKFNEKKLIQNNKLSIKDN